MNLIIPKSLTRIKQWFHNHLIQEVPTNLSVCEFDCKETDCDYSSWERCQRRNH